MYSSFRDLVRSLMPLSEGRKTKISKVTELAGEENGKQITYLLKTGKIDINFSRLGVSASLAGDDVYPEIVLRSKDPEVKKFAGEINEDIKEKVKKTIYGNFSKSSEEKILKCIAPNIFGLEYVKEAALLQLFSSEPVHILLLGDPGTGKTEILKSASQLHPISSFGLGSGTSGAGLGVSMKGDEVQKGLLPQADNGICCIDELNLMRKEDYAYLYSAMEKGFISYDKANRHIVMDTRIRVLATANPKGDSFVGKGIEILREQLPFDQALLSRFHLVFIIRKPDIEGFIHITKKIVDGDKTEISKKDVEFIREYVSYAESIKCEFPKQYKDLVVEFVARLGSRESEFLVELSPRVVIGLIRLCKARARMCLRNTVTKEDLEKVKDLLENSLIVKHK